MGTESRNANRANDLSPVQSTTASRSHIIASMEKSVSSRSERPVPRESYQMKRKARASGWAMPGYIAQSPWAWADPNDIKRTTGGPPPMLGEAMFTPSLVLAYWTCGSAIGPLSHRVQALRVGDALQHVLAAVVERHPRRRAGETPPGVRH